MKRPVRTVLLVWLGLSIVALIAVAVREGWVREPSGEADALFTDGERKFLRRFGWAVRVNDDAEAAFPLIDAAARAWTFVSDEAGTLKVSIDSGGEPCHLEVPVGERELAHIVVSAHLGESGLEQSAFHRDAWEEKHEGWRWVVAVLSKQQAAKTAATSDRLQVRSVTLGPYPRPPYAGTVYALMVEGRPTGSATVPPAAYVTELGFGVFIGAGLVGFGEGPEQELVTLSKAPWIYGSGRLLLVELGWSVRGSRRPEVVPVSRWTFGIDFEKS